MSITETVLIFVVVPAAIVLVVGALAYYGGGGRGGGRRYRPGRPYDFAPVWFLAAPERLSPATGAAELTTGPHREAIESAPAGPEPAAPPATVVQGGTGGASDRW